MKKALKWIAIALGSMIGLVALAAALVYIVSEARLRETYDITPAAIDIPEDADAIARGEHLATSIVACIGCHGRDLSGRALVDDPVFGLVTASNLTAGEGGIGGTYTDEDWVRALRHGVRPGGRALLLMPSHEIAKLSAEDTAAIIAYLKTVPPVDNVPAEDRVALMARILFLTGAFPLVPAELIDHNAPPASAVEAGPTAEYGEYLAIVCSGCHRQDLNGGPVTGAPPDVPPAANLTPHESGLGGWTEEDFFRVLREGVGPDGAQVDEFMPWMSFRNMEDYEIRAIWLYLQTLKPLPTGD